MGLSVPYLDWRLRKVAAVETGEEAFRVRQGAKTLEVPWVSIEAVTAFKRDQLIVDCLCLIVEFDGNAVELDEDMRGFELWLAMLESQLVITAEWRLAVLLPAFAANATEIFRRAPKAAAPGKPSRC